ncbi:MAG: hypothetical protein KAS72_12190 [Phycisphaerales bacterium]|nr:hypothetical protein [Phycisphaerales bacterium]
MAPTALQEPATRICGSPLDSLALTPATATWLTFPAGIEIAAGDKLAIIMHYA